MIQFRCNKTGWAILLTALNTMILALILAAMTSWANARSKEGEPRSLALATAGQIQVARLVVNSPREHALTGGRNLPKQTPVAPVQEVSRSLDDKLEQQMQRTLNPVAD